MSKYLKLGVMYKTPKYDDDDYKKYFEDEGYYKTMSYVSENDISNICKKYEDITLEEFDELIAKILYWLMKNQTKYIIVDLDKFNENFDCKKMTIKELEKELDDKGIDILELIGNKLGYKVKIIEEVGKHEAGRSDKE